MRSTYVPVGCCLGALGSDTVQLIQDAAQAVAGSHVVTWADGTEFDNSYDRGEPFTVVLGEGRVIQGWDQGLVGVQQGGRRQLDIGEGKGRGIGEQGQRRAPVEPIAPGVKRHAGDEETHLAGKLARLGQLTPESTREQTAAGLDAMSPAQRQVLTSANQSYHVKFGFPFIICARLSNKSAILAAMQARNRSAT